MLQISWMHHCSCICMNCVCWCVTHRIFLSFSPQCLCAFFSDGGWKKNCLKTQWQIEQALSFLSAKPNKCARAKQMKHQKENNWIFFSICHAQRQANTMAGYMLTFQLSYSWHGSYQLITYWLVLWQHKVLAFLWNAFHNAASFQQLTIIAHNLNAFNLNINTVPYLMTAHFTQSQNELGIYSCC